MENHRFSAIKIAAHGLECVNASERLVPIALQFWGFECWLVSGFLYRYGTPEFDGDAPEGVNVLSSGGYNEIWTDREGIAAMAPLVHADWTDIIGCSEVVGFNHLLKDFFGGEFVALSCIDSAHWICVSSDEDKLTLFAEKIPFSSERIRVDTASLGDWGL